MQRRLKEEETELEMSFCPFADPPGGTRNLEQDRGAPQEPPNWQGAGQSWNATGRQGHATVPLASLSDLVRDLILGMESCPTHAQALPSPASSATS